MDIRDVLDALYAGKRVDRMPPSSRWSQKPAYTLHFDSAANTIFSTSLTNPEPVKWDPTQEDVRSGGWQVV